MKIHNIPPSYQVYNNQKINKVNKVDLNAEPNLDIKISDKGKEYQFAMDKLKQVPDVRREKVDAISQQIKDGTYQIDSMQLAHAIRGYINSSKLNKE